MILSSSKRIGTCLILVCVAFCGLELRAENRFVNDSPRSGLRPGYDSNQCSTMIEECLRAGSESRTSCLYNTSQHLFCSNGLLGELAEQRSLLVSSPAVGQAAQNPKLIDNSCLEKFDNHFLARLIRGALDKAAVAELSNALDQCVQKSAPELLQP